MTNDDMMRGGGSKDEKRNLAQAFDDDFFGWGGEERGGTNQKNHPVCLVLCTKGKNINTQSGPRLQRAFNYSQEPNLRCFVAGPVLSRVTLTRGGGSQKVTNDDEGEGGVTIPPKIDDVIYEQPLKRAFFSTN